MKIKFFNSHQAAVDYLREEYGIRISRHTIPKLIKEKILKTVPVPGKNKNLITNHTVDEYVAMTTRPSSLRKVV